MKKGVFIGNTERRIYQKGKSPSQVGTCHGENQSFGTP